MWAALGILALLATLLTPLSTASAQVTVPGAPTNVTATPGNGQVTLRWTAPASDGGSTIIQYQYTQSGPTASGLWIPIPGSSRNTRSYTVTGLNNGGPNRDGSSGYRFQVRAVSGAGNGTASADSIVDADTNAAIPSTTPAAPTNLQRTPGNSLVTLTWAEATVNTAADGFAPIPALDGYEIRQKTGSGEYSPWATILDITTTDGVKSHIVTGLTNGATYQFEVRARNDNGPGAAAETTPVVIATWPGRPRSLTAVPGNRQVALSWTASSNGGSPITSWQFRQSTSASFPDLTTPAWVAIPGSDADTTSYTVIGLNNANQYTFQVRAVNAVGTGTFAQSATVDPGMPPGAPTGLDGSASANSITLTWTPPITGSSLNTGGSPILRYEYSQKTGSGDYGEWTAIPTTGTNSASTTATGAQTYTVSGLTAGTAYQFRVRAVNATGPGEADAMDGPEYPGTKPPAPASLSASPVYNSTTGSAAVTLSWSSGGDGGSPITRWEYLYNTSLATLSTEAGTASVPWTPICDNTQNRAPSCASTTSVTVPRPPTDPDDPTTAPDGTLTFVTDNALSTAEHHFVVRAVNAHGNGFQSGTDSARFSATVPSAPSAVYIGATTDNSITLVWRASVDGGSGITSYEFDVRTGSGSWATATDADGDNSNTTATYNVPPRTPPGTPLTFRVRAVNVLGASASTESPQTAGGAPPTPGAADIANAAGSPDLTARPATTQITLALVGTTGAGTGNNTRWEYSYKVGDGEYGNWAFSNTGAQFTPPDDDSNTDGSQISGLENGVQHTFRIRALNGQLSSPILESNPAIPGVAPPAPQGLTASAGNGSVTLSWTSGGSGGPPITKWQVCGGPSNSGCEHTGANWDDIAGSGADTTSHTITTLLGTQIPLSNSTTYSYLVRAVNAIGPGARAVSNDATPGKAPAGPSRVIVDADNGQVTITVDPPRASTDGVVVGYQVRKSQDGGPYDAWEALGSAVGEDDAASAHVATVTGLTNGASYTFQVRAVNVFGPGPEIESAAATPVGAPTVGELGADPGDGQVALSWAPGSSGGSAITKWQYRQSESGGGFGAWTDIADSGPTTSSHTVTGLSNGTSYTFQVRAVTQESTSIPISSASVTPGTVPVAPMVTAARGNGQVDLSWTAGTSSEAGATTGWQVRTDDGDWTDIADSGADTTSHSVAGLTNGTAYTFSVRAVNSFGAGAAGSASATPATTPSAPEVSAERGDGSTAVSWTAGDNGGSALTGWQIQVNDGGWIDVGADMTSLSVDTDDGAAFTFSVRGVNDVGQGAAGSASVEAGSAPAAPTVTATGANGEITVSWTAGDDGGSSVTSWHHRMKVSIGDYGDWTEVSADTTSVALSDLGGGTGVLSYTFQVRGVNGVGAGEAGTSNEVMPVEASPANGVFYSGVIDGPDFCTNMSLGGARLYAHDWDGDGVADVCSLPYTRREAIARQNAVESLALQYSSEYVALVMAACAVTEGEDSCGEDMQIEPPAVPINDGGPFYSGVITGPSFCANRSLGGQPTFPHDDDKDGVADVCSYAYSTREAIARQLAGDILVATYPSDFRRELASSCRGLTGANYGDDPEDMARDACA